MVEADDRPAKLLKEDWLSVEVPQGQQSISFRYRPLDVMVGTVLTVLGIVLAVWMSFRIPVEAAAVEDTALIV